MTSTLPLEAAIGALTKALREAGSPFMLIGGIAVIARGVARVTTDVDATVRALGGLLEELAATLARHGIEGRIPDLLEFARRNHVLLLRHQPTGTPIEITLAWLPFEEEALSRADQIDFGSTTAPVASVEDLIVYKAVAWRDRDRSDIERLLVQYGDRVDLARVRRIVAEFADAMDVPERTSDLEALIGRSKAAD